MPKPNRRWLRFTPDRLILGLLAVEGFLWLSERFRWFPFNEHKGWTVLIAVVSVGVAFLVMLLWFVASLLCRWRFQFSIRCLLVLVVVVAIPCSWLAAEMKKARQQREEVAAIEGLGICVAYGYKFDQIGGQWPLGREELPGHPWLRCFLGDDFFADVVDVSFFDSEVNDAVLEHLTVLPRLQDLTLFSSRVSDLGLEFIGKLTQLEHLTVADSHITDCGLKHLTRLTQLQYLCLDGNDITDTGLDHLKGLTKLEYLSLRDTRVTAEGVKKLQQALPNCEIFWGQRASSH